MLVVVLDVSAVARMDRGLWMPSLCTLRTMSEFKFR